MIRFVILGNSFYKSVTKNAILQKMEKDDSIRIIGKDPNQIVCHNGNSDIIISFADINPNRPTKYSKYMDNATFLANRKEKDKIDELKNVMVKRRKIIGISCNLLPSLILNSISTRQEKTLYKVESDKITKINTRYPEQERYSFETYEEAKKYLLDKLQREIITISGDTRRYLSHIHNMTLRRDKIDNIMNKL